MADAIRVATKMLNIDGAFNRPGIVDGERPLGGFISSVNRRRRTSRSQQQPSAIHHASTGNPAISAAEELCSAYHLINVGGGWEMLLRLGAAPAQALLTNTCRIQDAREPHFIAHIYGWLVGLATLRMEEGGGRWTCLLCLPICPSHPIPSHPIPSLRCWWSASCPSVSCFRSRFQSQLPCHQHHTRLMAKRRANCSRLGRASTGIL